MTKYSPTSGKFGSDSVPNMPASPTSPKRRKTLSGGSLSPSNSPKISTGGAGAQSRSKLNTQKQKRAAGTTKKYGLQSVEPDQIVAELFANTKFYLGLATLNLIFVIISLTVMANSINLPEGFSFSMLSNPLQAYLSFEEIREAGNAVVMYITGVIAVFVVGSMVGIIAFVKARQLNKLIPDKLNALTRWVCAVTPVIFVMIVGITSIKFVFTG